MRKTLGNGDWVADSIQVQRQDDNFAYLVTIDTVECAYPVDLITFDAIGSGVSALYNDLEK